jgi:hypothetical protein
MAPETRSDFIPFRYEPVPRADRILERRDAQKISGPKPPDGSPQSRSPENPRDKTLSKVAEEWSQRLPPQLQTHALCEQYPRVANRIALCWSDPVLARVLLAQLLTDHRGGRKGFPAPVHAELAALAAAVGRTVRT